MIKLVYALARRPDMTQEEFSHHWLNVHAPLIADNREIIRAKKYVQSHLIDTPANEALRAPRGMLPPLAGVAELWYDSVEDFQAAGQDPRVQAIGPELAADELLFIDHSGSQFFFTEEHTIFDYSDKTPIGPDAIKCAYLLKRKDGMTPEETHRTWLHDHGPLVTSFSPVTNTTKYVQSHAIAYDVNEAIAAARGFVEPLDGLTEVWIADPNSRSEPTEESRHAGEAMAEDERRFVQMDKSRCFMTKEHVIFDHIS